MKKVHPTQERRQYPRITAPVLYRSPRLFSLKRRISNISMGGVRILSDEYLKLGKKLELEFFLPNGNSITATAKVVWIQELNPGSEAQFEVGLEFIDWPLYAQMELKALIDESSD